MFIMMTVMMIICNVDDTDNDDGTVQMYRTNYLSKVQYSTVQVYRTGYLSSIQYSTVQYSTGVQNWLSLT